jgi:hypothetical protein
LIPARLHLVPLTDLPARAPEWVLLEEGLEPAEAPSGRPLVLRAQVATLNSPDTVELVTSQREGARFEFAIEHRVFEGILGANVQSKAILEAHVGALAPGRYEVRVTTHELGFSRLEHPEEAQPRTSTSRTLAFTVL